MCTNPLKIIVNNEEVTVKCGKCDTCKREKAQDWAIKLINEAKYHKKASFITLTFDNKILLDKKSKAYKYGANASFVFNIDNSKEYFKKFMKRLRKKYSDKAITFFHVGEYGEKTHRPHHHVIIFGENFEDDRFEIEKSKSGKKQFFSPTLFELWACGRISVQDINPNNIAYIAQYNLKKYRKNPKYKTIMSFSNRSKISTKWIRRNPYDIIKGYLEDEEGKKYKVPESYKKELKNAKKEKLKNAYRIYEERMLNRITNIPNNELIEMQRKKEEQIKIRTQFYDKKRDF